MFAALNPDAEMGPAGMIICAGLLAVGALGTFVTGFHPRWRLIAKWKGGVPRSAFGSLAFSVGLLIMSLGMIIRGVLNHNGPFSDVELWLLCSGMIVLIIGPIYDLIQKNRNH